MNTHSRVWHKLARSKKYREEFVAAQVKRGIPFQARALLKSREGWTQQRLAKNAGLTQGVVSRALDPNYGNLTLNTIIRIAAGFDVAFIGKFVPFSELERWFFDLSEESGRVPSFTEEQEQFRTVQTTANAMPHAGTAPVMMESANKVVSIEDFKKALTGRKQEGFSFQNILVVEQKVGGAGHEAIRGGTR